MDSIGCVGVAPAKLEAELALRYGIAAKVIVQGGGVLGRRRVRSPIQPTYRVGAEVIVFVVFNSRGEAVTLGLNQGKFDVARQPKTGLVTVRNPFHGLPKRDDPRAVVKRALGQTKLQEI